MLVFAIKPLIGTHFKYNKVIQKCIEFLFDHFSERSRYEKNDPCELIFDLYRWEKQNRPYQAGVQIFNTYFRGNNLKHLFNSHETPVLKQKLDFKLQLQIKSL